MTSKSIITRFRFLRQSVQPSAERNLHHLAQNPRGLPDFVRQSPVAMRYLDLLSPLVLIGHPSPSSDLYERAIKTPPDTEPSDIRSVTENWPTAKTFRQSAKNRIRKLQKTLQENWRLRLWFERGRVDPLHAAINDIRKSESLQRKKKE